MDNQHLVMWRSPGSTQRQARELISRPDLATRARLLSFNRAQSRGCHWSSNRTQNPEATFICNGAEW